VCAKKASHPVRAKKPQANVNEIDLRCQLHQHFTNIFSAIFWRQKISNPKHSLVIFGAKISNEKRARKTLMKLTAGRTYSPIVFS